MFVQPLKRWDTIIVGQGLAGTTLAWHLLEGGERVLILDPDRPNTASKIAAGLITPITGQRLALSWRVDEMLAAARAFYARIERRIGVPFFYPRPAIRLFQNDAEREIWSKRRLNDSYVKHLSVPQPDVLLDPAIGDANGGGFQMETGQLNVAEYLAASRDHLAVGTAEIDWSRDVTFHADHVAVLGAPANRVISAEGYAATRNPFFAWLPFKGAKGDILTIRFERALSGASVPATPSECLHRGIWIVPTSEPHTFRVGATYDWDNLDDRPSAAGRAEIEERLRDFIRVPYKVIDHKAAVRPIIRESKALIGLHPTQPRLGFFNGLGSKGALHAPWFAKNFADHLLNGSEIPRDVDLRHRKEAAEHVF